MGASDRRARGEAHAPVRTDRRALSAGGRASVRFRSAGAEVLSSFDGDVIGRGLAAGGAWRVAGRRVAVGPRGCRSPPRHGLQTEPAGPYQLTIPPPAPCSYSHGYATASLYVLLQSPAVPRAYTYAAPRDARGQRLAAVYCSTCTNTWSPGGNGPGRPARRRVLYTIIVHTRGVWSRVAGGDAVTWRAATCHVPSRAPPGVFAASRARVSRILNATIASFARAPPGVLV